MRRARGAAPHGQRPAGRLAVRVRTHRAPTRARLVAVLLGPAVLLAAGLGVAVRAERAHPTAQPLPGLTSPSPAPTPSRGDGSPTGAPVPASGRSATPGASRAPAGAPTTTPAAPTTSRASRPGPASGERTLQAYLTGYSYFDNTPPGSVDISDPVLHQSAGGTGTYADPITVAVGHSLVNGRDILDWPAGTRFYVPNLRRYFIVEDTCGDGSSPQTGPCHVGYPSSSSTWLDLWVGGAGGTSSGADACMNSITGVWTVVVAPAATYPTTAGPVYGASGCTRQYGNAVLAA